jgi:hypothetical protein
MIEEGNVYIMISMKNLEERDHFEDLEASCRIMLK